MLTIAPLKQRSIDYYNDTARAAISASMDRQRAGGGLAEYYSKGESRAPVWICVGDTDKAAELVGLSPADRAGGQADMEAVARWLPHALELPHSRPPWHALRAPDFGLTGAAFGVYASLPLDEH